MKPSEAHKLLFDQAGCISIGKTKLVTTITSTPDIIMFQAKNRVLSAAADDEPRKYESMTNLGTSAQRERCPLRVGKAATLSCSPAARLRRIQRRRCPHSPRKHRRRAARPACASCTATEQGGASDSPTAWEETPTSEHSQAKTTGQLQTASYSSTPSGAERLSSFGCLLNSTFLGQHGHVSAEVMQKTPHDASPEQPVALPRLSDSARELKTNVQLTRPARTKNAVSEEVIGLSCNRLFPAKFLRTAQSRTAAEKPSWLSPCDAMLMQGNSRGKSKSRNPPEC